MKSSNYLKVYVTCPVDYVADIQKAIWDVWAGKQWNYSHCSFVTTQWKGYFTPQEWASPAIWKIWKSEVVNESKIEFICEKSKIENVIKAMLDAHPYEEVGYDIIERLDID